MLRLLVRCFACLLLAVYTLSAAPRPAEAKPQKAAGPRSRSGEGGGGFRRDASDGAATEAAESAAAEPRGGLSSAFPHIRDETRRPCHSLRRHQGRRREVERRYKATGKKWTKVRQREMVGLDREIPCMALTKRGALNSASGASTPTERSRHRRS